jgi:hypothetical protein
MSAGKQDKDKSGVVVRSFVESKRGAALLVERLQLTPAGTLALTTTAKNIAPMPSPRRCDEGEPVKATASGL